MTFEAAVIGFAGLAFMWLGSEVVKTRDAVLKLYQSMYGERGLEHRVEGIAKRVHNVESEVVGLKLLHDTLAENVTRLENRMDGE